MKLLTVIGAGLAGSEAAWQAAERGVRVRLFEMRPARGTGAHRGGDFAELVCSNSLGSSLPDRATGVLMSELRLYGSELLRIAGTVAVPAGGSLAVDRGRFARLVTERLSAHPNIEIVREEATAIPEGCAIVASGPLTSDPLSAALADFGGGGNLYFFDALAPIVHRDSIDFGIAYRASRYGRGTQEDGDYINCPLTREEYDRFVDALVAAERIPLKSFEEAIAAGVRAGEGAFFEGCLPVEVIAQRGRQSLWFGPMKAIGLDDPRTGRHPYAAVQLRQDNLAGDLYNMVGFQTNLRHAEQERVFRMIPGLGRAEFVRHGEMHRNTFLNAPRLLRPTLQFVRRDDLFAAGQLTGVEGYLGNIATGWLAGVNAARVLGGLEPLSPPSRTMLGALCRYITQADSTQFQPMKANLGILPPLPEPVPRGKRERAAAHAARARDAAAAFFESAR